MSWIILTGIGLSGVIGSVAYYASHKSMQKVSVKTSYGNIAEFTFNGDTKIAFSPIPDPPPYYDAYLSTINDTLYANQPSSITFAGIFILSVLFIVSGVVMYKKYNVKTLGPSQHHVSFGVTVGSTVILIIFGLMVLALGLISRNYNKVAGRVVTSNPIRMQLDDGGEVVTPSNPTGISLISTQQAPIYVNKNDTTNTTLWLPTVDFYILSSCLILTTISIVWGIYLWRMKN